MRRLAFFTVLALAAPLAAAQSSSAMACARILRLATRVGPVQYRMTGLEFSRSDLRLQVSVDVHDTDVTAQVTLPAGVAVRCTAGLSMLVSSKPAAPGEANTLGITIHNR